jgi:hypothetical protein
MIPVGGWFRLHPLHQMPSTDTSMLSSYPSDRNMSMASAGPFGVIGATW